MITMIVTMMYELGDYRPDDKVYQLYQKISNWWDEVLYR